MVGFRADSLSGPWSQPFIVTPLNMRSFNSQSGNSLRIKGSRKTTYLYLGDQVHAISTSLLLLWLLTELVGFEFSLGKPIHLASGRNRREEE